VLEAVRRPDERTREGTIYEPQGAKGLKQRRGTTSEAMDLIGDKWSDMRCKKGLGLRAAKEARKRGAKGQGERHQEVASSSRRGGSRKESLRREWESRSGGQWRRVLMKGMDIEAKGRKKRWEAERKSSKGLRPTSAITYSHHPRNTSGNIPSVIDPHFFPGPQSGPRSRSRGNRARSGASVRGRAKRLPRGRGGNGQHLPTNHMLRYSNGGAERGCCRVAY
jgi:hypothetical protein